MSNDKTGIEWTESTWSPIRGCSMVSAGCTNCYAMKIAHRFNGKGLPYEGLTREGKWTGEVRLVEKDLDKPIRWKKGRRIFVNPMSDLFHESLADETIDRIFAVMSLAPQHTFQVLTKRARRMRDYFAADYVWSRIEVAARRIHRDRTGQQIAGKTLIGPLRNVMLGVSVENQAEADERIPWLLRTQAAWRFISGEPLLGPVNLHAIQIPDEREGLRFSALKRQHDDRFGSSDALLDWVIVGGESGPGARPMHPDWARALRDQCAAAGVPFFFKQWGEWAPGHGDLQPLKGEPGSLVPMTTVCSTDRKSIGERTFAAFGAERSWRLSRVGKKAAGALLDGAAHKAFPEVARG